MAEKPRLSIVKTGLAARCPTCGKGRLFQGFLKVRPQCEACGQDFSHFDSADGPAVFIMMVVGFVVGGAALWVETNYAPPYWVHALLWGPLTVALGLGLMRPFKGVMIVAQHLHDARPGQLDRPDQP